MLTLEQRSEIYTRVDHFISIACDAYNTELEGPYVRFDKRGTCGGTANYSLNELNFNAGLMLDNWDEYLNQIIPHEVAHLVKNAVYGAERKGELMRPHGTYWQRIMRQFGIEPDRSHRMDISKVQQPKRKFVYECECCSTEFVLSSVKHNRIVRGQSIFAHCGETIVFRKALGKMTTMEARSHKLPKFIKQAAAPKAGTKIAHAMTIYKAMVVDGVRASRKDTINAIANSMQIAPHAASGYYQNCKKRIG